MAQAQGPQARLPGLSVSDFKCKSCSVGPCAAARAGRACPSQSPCVVMLVRQSPSVVMLVRRSQSPSVVMSESVRSNASKAPPAAAARASLGHCHARKWNFKLNLSDLAGARGLPGQPASECCHSDTASRQQDAGCRRTCRVRICRNFNNLRV